MSFRSGDKPQWLPRSNSVLPRSLCSGQAGWGPVLKFLPYVLRFQPEGITDRDEGEEPARVVAGKPSFSLPRAPNEPPLRLKLLLETEEGIFQYGVHQCGLRAYSYQADSRVEELFRNQGGIGRPLVPGIPVVRYTLSGRPFLSGDTFSMHRVFVYLPALWINLR